MASRGPSFLPFKLGGTNNFSEEASYSHDMFHVFSSTILKALGSVSPSLDQPFVIADYGTADGGASYNIIRQCITQLRTRYGPDLPIQVVYLDQPVNDFQPVFARADGLLPGLEGLNSEFGNVYVTACGTSFYRQCLPDDSLDFILSSTSLHWLSRCPVEMPRDIFPNLSPPQLRGQFREQARLDLKRFIRHRERELKSGGRMILINVGCKPEIPVPVLRVITEAWRSLVSDDTITQAEFSNTNFAMYIRSVEEWMEPFDRQTGLKPISSQSSEVYWDRDITGKAGSVSPSLDQPFVIADYGTADGGASYNIIRQCITQLRTRYGPDLPIQVVYLDQPVNDFQPVFARADGLLPGLEGLNSEFGNVYVTACGTSFYRQCLPDDSLDFILSSTSLHWLSRCPVEMPRDIFPNLSPPQLRGQFREQARLDLKRFIRHRERELKSGGRMILINVGCKPEIPVPVLRVITEAWRSLVSDDTITQAEFSNTNFAMYIRSVEEWMEPFDRQTGLKPISSQSSEVYWDRDITGKAGSLEEFGRSVVRSIRSWTDCNLYTGLSDHRSHAQKMDVLDTYYERLFLHLIANEESVKRTLPVLCLDVEQLSARNAGNYYAEGYLEVAIATASEQDDRQ